MICPTVFPNLLQHNISNVTIYFSSTFYGAQLYFSASIHTNKETLGFIVSFQHLYTHTQTQRQRPPRSVRARLLLYHKSSPGRGNDGKVIYQPTNTRILVSFYVFHFLFPTKMLKIKNAATRLMLLTSC